MLASCCSLSLGAMGEAGAARLCKDGSAGFSPTTQEPWGLGTILSSPRRPFLSRARDSCGQLCHTKR